MSRGNSSLLDGIEQASGTAVATAPTKSGGKSGTAPIKRIAAIGGCFAALLILAYVVTNELRAMANSPSATSRIRQVIDAKTGVVDLEFRVEDGMAPPFLNAHGEATLWPAEPCYWTREGGVKVEPTWVLLNTYIDKPEDTICPDCGRKVVAHNPLPPAQLFQKLADTPK